MPHVTIIPSDHCVYIDREAMQVDCSDVVDEERPELRVHAVQWNGKVGWIEYENDPFDDKNYVPNREIRDVAQFQKFIDQWSFVKARVEAERTEKEEADRKMREAFEAARKT
jgi:hypothetical protein